MKSQYYKHHKKKWLMDHSKRKLKITVSGVVTCLSGVGERHTFFSEDRCGIRICPKCRPRFTKRLELADNCHKVMIPKSRKHLV